MGDLNLCVQWHAPDLHYVAVFVRDGQEWWLDGALVGFGGTPGSAVTELCELAEHLVIEGENFLTEGQIALADRRWLFSLLDPGSSRSDEMYVALRKANDARPSV